MPAPRPKQRMPRGGVDLWERVRRDYEPDYIIVVRAGDVPRKIKLPLNGLMWDGEFDPMIYFWPVDRQHVEAFFSNGYDAAQAKRLVRACLRDGAREVVVVHRRPAPVEWKREPWGAPDFEYVEVLRESQKNEQPASAVPAAPVPAEGPG